VLHLNRNYSHFAMADFKRESSDAQVLTVICSTYNMERHVQKLFHCIIFMFPHARVADSWVMLVRVKPYRDSRVMKVLQLISSSTIVQTDKKICMAGQYSTGLG